MIRISRIDRVGGPRKSHAERTSWQIRTSFRIDGKVFICETDTRKEARELAGIIVALRCLAGLES